MSKEIKLYPYGFILSDETIKNIPEQSNQLRIFDNYDYYFDSIYNPSVFETKTSFIIIHGHFVHIGFDENINNLVLSTYLLNKYLNIYDKFLNTFIFIA